jgi:hypothetical protein
MVGSTIHNELDLDMQMVNQICSCHLSISYSTVTTTLLKFNLFFGFRYDMNDLRVARAVNLMDPL